MSEVHSNRIRVTVIDLVLFAGKTPLIDARAGTLATTQVIHHIAARGVIAPRVEGRLRVLE